MGRDKAFDEVDGVAMVMRVAAALRAAGCDPVFAVGGNRDAVEALGIGFVADRFPGEGPVGGVISAIDACDTAGVVVVACDLPHLTADTVRSLMEPTGTAQVMVAFTGRVQPLCALWTRQALPHVRDAFAEGERRLTAVLARLEIAQVPANPQDLANVNTPGDVPQ